MLIFNLGVGLLSVVLTVRYSCGYLTVRGVHIIMIVVVIVVVVGIV